MVRSSIIFLLFFSVFVFSQTPSSLKQAQNLFNDKEYQDSLEAVGKVLDENPYYRKALFLKGNILFELNEKKEAEKLWQQVYKIDTSFIPVLFRLGQFYFDEKKYDKSVFFYKAILNIEPLNVKAKLGIVQNDRETMQFNKAKEGLTEIQRLAPGNPEIFYQWGLLALDTKNYTKAENYFLKTKKLDQNFGKAYSQLGKLKLYTKDYKAAEYYFNESTKIDKSNLENYTALAQLHILTKEWNKARKLYKNIEKYFKDESLFYYNFAVLDLALKKKTAFFNHIDQSLDIDSGEPFSRLLYFFQLKDSTENLERSHNLGREYFKMGKNFYEDGNYSKAIQFYRRGLMLYPESSTNRYAFAMCFKRLGNVKRYLKELKITLSLNSDVDKWNFQYEKDKRKQDFALKRFRSINPSKTPTKILVFPFKSSTLDTYHLRAGELLAREEQLYLNNRPYVECSYFNGKGKNKYKKIQNFDFFIEGDFVEKDNFLKAQVSLYSTYDRKKIETISFVARNNNRINVVLENLYNDLRKVIPFKGEIFKIENEKVYVNLGKEDGLKESDSFSLYDAKKSNGFEVDKKNTISELTISSLYDDFLIAVLKDPKKINKVKLHQSVRLVSQKKKNAKSQ